MVIKQLTCEFTDYKISPGHGLRYAELNGKTHMFINSKIHRLYKNGKKPLKIRWTLKWRTAHKKGKLSETKKKVQRQKKVRQVKAVVGLSVQEINEITQKLTNSKENDAQRYKFAQEIKEKKKRYLEKIKKTRQEKAPKEKAYKNVKPKTGYKGH